MNPNKKVIRREKLFEKYYSNLIKILSQNKINYDKNTPFYICPICRRYFLEETLNQSFENPLTIEHVPPEAVGGKGTILTCKECNNNQGSKLDVHLTKKIKQSKFFNLEEGAKFSTRFVIDEEFVSDGYVEIDENKKINIIFQEGRTAPKNRKIAKGIALGKAKKGKVSFKTVSYSHSKFKLAILRSAFLMLFSELGYGFLFTKNSDIPRKMILEGKIPEDYDFLITGDGLPDEFLGIHIIKKPKELNSYLVVLKIKKDNFNQNFAVLIPGANKKGRNLYLDYRKIVRENRDIKLELEEIQNFNYVDNEKYVQVPISAWKE